MESAHVIRRTPIFLSSQSSSLQMLALWLQKRKGHLVFGKGYKFRDTRSKVLCSCSVNTEFTAFCNCTKCHASSINVKNFVLPLEPSLFIVTYVHASMGLSTLVLVLKYFKYNIFSTCSFCTWVTNCPRMAELYGMVYWASTQ